MLCFVVIVFYICWFMVGVIKSFVVVVRYSVVSKLFVILWVSLVMVFVVVGVISRILVYFVNLICFIVVLVVGLSSWWCIGFFDIVWSDNELMNFVVEFVRIICMFVFNVVSLCIRLGVL